MDSPQYRHHSEYLGRFFQLYDSLQRQASSLSSDRQSLYDARDEHTRLAHELRKTKAAVAANKDFIEEQKGRIKLVSTHWFYGTTMFQPQLWLRGGCAGKIERARVKLANAEEDRPKLEQMENGFRQREMAANERVRGREAAYGRASDAAKEMKQMKEEIVLNHPSHRLNGLEQHEAALKRDVADEMQRKKHLVEVGSTLNKARKCLGSLESETRSAEKNVEDANRLSKKEVTLTLPSSGSTATKSLENGGKEVIREGHWYRDYKKYDAEGAVVLTNHPCPNGCGYVVTWHRTHCCHGCANKQGHRHGGKCERIELRSQAGAQELWDRLEKQRRDHKDKVESLRLEALRSMENATRELQNGSACLRRAASNLSGFNGSQMPSTPQMGLCSGASSCCPASVPSQASQLRLQASKLLSSVKEQESLLRQLEREYDRERRRLDQELRQVRSQIVEEKNNIFDSLRASLQTEPRRDPPSATAPHPSAVATATVISVVPEDCVSGSVLGEKE